jgi:hypothetical protein
MTSKSGKLGRPQGERGNIDNPFARREADPNVGSVKYIFTLNNWKNEEMKDIEKWCSNRAKKWIFGEEIGDQNKVPHLQGYFEIEKKKRFTVIQSECPGFKRAWFHNANGTLEENITYCSKQHNEIHTNQKIPEPKKMIKNLFEWQKDMEHILLTDKSDRTVYWIYDPEGGNGKTQFLKYMYYKYSCLFTCGGKRNDIINLIYNGQKYMEESNAIVLWNLPRDINDEFISYEAIEMIKDGCISNNKFECGCFCCNSPNICIFGNKLPNIKKLTFDRWKIFTIIDHKLIKWEKSKDDSPLDVL